jgi:hypothetical protein
MYRYTAYGLNIQAGLRLPELAAGTGRPDVTLRLGRVPPPIESTGLPVNAIGLVARPGEVRLWWRTVGAAEVRHGREVTVERAPSVGPAAFRQFVLGPVLAVALQQRGFLVLHASGIVAARGAVIVLGDSGAGKSTLAAVLHRQGHGIVADDVVAVHVASDDVAAVLPGFPHVTPRPPPTGAVAGRDGEAPSGAAVRGKEHRHAARGFPAVPLPLRRVYVLADGPQVSIQPLRPPEAFRELLRHAYPAAAHLSRSMGTGDAHVQMCLRVASSVSVHRLTRERTLSTLPEVLRLVERDLATIEQPQG